jgi:hypothetical protein
MTESIDTPNTLYSMTNQKSDDHPLSSALYCLFITSYAWRLSATWARAISCRHLKSLFNTQTNTIILITSYPNYLGIIWTKDQAVADYSDSAVWDKIGVALGWADHSSKESDRLCNKNQKSEEESSAQQRAVEPIKSGWTNKWIHKADSFLI